MFESFFCSLDTIFQAKRKNNATLKSGDYLKIKKKQKIAKEL